MARNDLCLYNSIHLIPIYEKNGYSEDRNLNITIFDYGDKLEFKIKDLSDSAFNYTEYLDLGDFEVIRMNQLLDINYMEFKSNIVDMLQQFQKKEMLLKCQLKADNNCSLIFYTKTKIKNIIYLSLDLRITDQKKILSEMYLEINELQDLNQKLQKEISQSQKVISDKETKILKLETERKIMLNQFCKTMLQIQEVVDFRLEQVNNQVLKKISSFKEKINHLDDKVNRLKEENHLKSASNNRLINTLDELRLENIEQSKSIEQLRRENVSLNMLKNTLERNVTDLKNSVEQLEDKNLNLTSLQTKLEKELQILSVHVTQKDSKLNELSKDLVQANSMLVQFNSQYDIKVSEIEELQEAMQIKEKLLNEQKCYANELLLSFQDYKKKFNNDKMKDLEMELLESNKKNHKLEEELRKLNKINAILTKKVGQAYLPNTN